MNDRLYIVLDPATVTLRSPRHKTSSIRQPAAFGRQMAGVEREHEQELAKEKTRERERERRKEKREGRKEKAHGRQESWRGQ